MIDNINCPLGKNNFLEVKFFVPALEVCADHCREVEGCRYYWWYPIENSETPLYCFLYQQCAASDKEPEVALVIGGRHPGHHFMTEDEHNDLIMRSDVCMLGILDKEVSVARAGAVAQHVNGVVLFCGGLSNSGIHSDCLMYNPLKDSWSNFTSMIKARDEASVALAGNVTYVISGLNDASVEFIDMTNFVAEPKVPAIEEIIPKSRQKTLEIEKAPEINPGWKLGPPLPEIRARACAVSGGPDTIYLIGMLLKLSEKNVTLCKKNPSEFLTRCRATATLSAMLCLDFAEN